MQTRYAESSIKIAIEIHARTTGTDRGRDPRGRACSAGPATSHKDERFTRYRAVIASIGQRRGIPRVAPLTWTMSRSLVALPVAAHV